MNLLLGAVLFMIVYMVGKTEMKPQVGYLQAGSPADLGGLQVGDEIRAINGASINSFEQIQTAVVLADPFSPLEVDIERDGQRYTRKIVPETSEMTQLLQIGIGPAQNTVISIIAPEYLNQAGPHARLGDTIVGVGDVPITPEQGQRMWDLLHQGGSAPVEFTVRRPDPADPQGPPVEQTLQVRKDVMFLPNGLNTNTSPRDLLGLMPRLRVSEVQSQSEAEEAGLLAGDVITSWGGISHPTHAEIWASHKMHAGQTIPVRVRRRGETLDRVLYYVPRVRLRDQVHKPLGLEIEPGDGQAVVAQVAQGSRAAAAGLEPGDVIRRWNTLDRPTAAALQDLLAEDPECDARIWVEREGQPHTAPLNLRSNLMPVPGFQLDMMEQDPVVVAGVVERDEFFMRPSAASSTSLTKGCRITALDGVPVKSWADLADGLIGRAGGKATIAYVPPQGGAEQTTTMNVPESPWSGLGLPVMSASAQTINFRLDGQGEVEVDLLGTKMELPAFRPEAIAHYLAERVGQQVQVTFQNEAGEVVDKVITVEEGSIDPWDRRVSYALPFRTGAVTYLNRKTNPLAAVWAGTLETYYSLAKGYLTLRRMIFTRSVGVEKMSGPIGILHLGSEIAKVSTVAMLYFLGFLSVNLAVFNFLPLPIVDGGLMVFLIIEKIKGSPVSVRVQVATQMLGLALLGTTFLLVTFNDISKLFG
jgi:membrane-associated protease RseP (regulator of RpoE activity)